MIEVKYKQGSTKPKYTYPKVMLAEDTETVVLFTCSGKGIVLASTCHEVGRYSTNWNMGTEPVTIQTVGD